MSLDKLEALLHVPNAIHTVLRVYIEKKKDIYLMVLLHGYK